MEYFYDTRQKCRTEPGKVSCTRITTLPFLLLALSPFVMSDSDYPLISCQLCLPYFCCYFPLLYLTLIMYWFSVCSVSRTLFGIFWWYLVVMKKRTRQHVTYKNDNFGFFTFGVISPSCVWISFLVSALNTNTLQNILMMLGTNVEQDEMTCCVQERQLWRGGGGVVGTFVCLFFLKNLF